MNNVTQGAWLDEGDALGLEFVQWVATIGQAAPSAFAGVFKKIVQVQRANRPR